MRKIEFANNVQMDAKNVLVLVHPSVETANKISINKATHVKINVILAISQINQLEIVINAMILV